MKRLWLVVPLALVVIASACSSSSSTATSSGSVTGQVTLTMWMGYTPPPPVDQSQEYLSIQDMVTRFEAAHPNIHIDLQYVNSDNALQKATVALQGGKQPDISYQYGTNMPQLATAPKLVDLTQRVQDPSFDWNDFFEGERAVATVDGRVLGIPALDPANKVFGLVFPADGSETMVWQFEAMLWEAGGDILNADNTQAAFNSPAGVRAATMLQQMQQDGSLYLDFHPDSGQYTNLFNSGKIGMLITGPWDLSAFPNVHYGVVQMPSFDPGGSHITIAGPDNWVIFDNGPDRVEASWEFLQFMASPENVLKDSLATSHLPTRASVEQLPGFATFDSKYPGVGTFAQNLVNVTKARPQVTQYPQVSSFLGLALVSILQGQASPQDALNQAANQANGVLAVPA
ncbi:MAG: ABC transporter substrate-binding protein [Actinobacteria bacterium]|nr:MAG: ABC transporter substrate-binding protein [Actinomycetota bacterium]